jgi:glyoxylase-like metal-dependent hydrolase (beta-lactamase superfamily II)
MKIFKATVITFLLASVSLPRVAALAEKVPNVAPGFALQEMQRLSDQVYVARLAPHLWVHTTVGTLADGTLYAANGMLLEQRDHSILFDVGWTPEQARTLLNWARDTLKHPVEKAYVTHFHNDRLGGIPGLETEHIPVFGTSATIDLAKRAGQPVPDHSISVPSTPVTVAEDADIFFPGAGHTLDNIVVDFPAEHVVFGGCFIKAASAEGIGNTADADLNAWPDAVRRMQGAFPHTKFAVPGHGPIANDIGQRTLELLQKSSPTNAR